jgi:hypothetical protein
VSNLVKDLSALFVEGAGSTDATRAAKIPKKSVQGGKSASTVKVKKQSKLKANSEYKKVLETYVRTGKLPRDVKKELAEDKSPILQHLALAAQAQGVDIDDETAFKAFYNELKDAVRDKSKLKTVMRTWTAGKGRAAMKTLKTAVM